MLKKYVSKVLLVAMLTSIATFAFAEDAAPVYDADNYPPAFDGQQDNGGSANGGGSSNDSTVSAGDSDVSPGDSNVSTKAVPPPAAYAPSQSMSLEQRMSRAEQQINNMQGKDVSDKIDTLQAEIQSLRGQVDQLTHQLQQAQTQQHKMYSDLDQRINSSQKGSNKKLAAITPDDTIAPSTVNNQDTATPPASPVIPVKTKSNAKTAQLNKKTKVVTETKTTTASASTTAATPAPKSDAQQPNVAEEQQIYQTAYDLIKAKKYNEAINALQKMLQKYPSGQFAANAHYWLGELYGLLGKNGQSASEFNAVVQTYPDSPKVSDAQLKLGLIFAAEFKWIEAKSAFKQVINHYPGTASARLAAEQLKQIKEAGH